MDFVETKTNKKFKLKSMASKHAYDLKVMTMDVFAIYIYTVQKT